MSKRNPFEKDDIPLKKLTRYAAEKESKRRAQETSEVIDLVGQENTSKALPFIQEKARVEEKQKTEELSTELSTLIKADKFSKKDPTWDPYRQRLCQIVIKRVQMSTWPKGYNFKALATDKGVALVVLTPERKIYAHGFRPCHFPNIDLNAVNTLVMQAENRIDKLEEIRKPKQSSTLIKKL